MFRATIDDNAELRFMEERHASEIYRVVDRNRDYLARWLPWVDGTRGPEDVLAFIRRALDQFARNEGFHAGVWSNRRFVGAVGLKPINWIDRKVEIGYWLDAEVQGRGLITRACRLVIEHIFGELDLNRVEIRVAEGNARSLAIVRRLGAVPEGVDRQASVLRGQFVDIHRFALVRGSAE